MMEIERGFTYLSQVFFVKSHAAVGTLDVVHHAPSDDFLGCPDIAIDNIDHEAENPHGEAHRAVGHANGKLQWLGFLYQAVSRKFGFEMIEIFDCRVFVRGGQSQRVALKIGGIWWSEPHVIKHRQHCGRIVTSHVSKDEAAEISALDYIVGVT